MKSYGCVAQPERKSFELVVSTWSGKCGFVRAILLQVNLMESGEERVLRNAIVHRGAPISIRMAIELLRRGADPTANRRNGKYAFAHTAEIRNQELVTEHINKGKNLFDDRPDTLRFREYFKLCELIELRVKEIKNLVRTLNYHIDFADLINMSPLRSATYRGRVRVVRALIELGADPNIEQRAMDSLLI